MSRFRRPAPPGPGARLDPTHPLTQGLILCLPMQEGGGTLIRDLSQSGNDLSGSTGWSPGKYGPAVGPSSGFGAAHTPRDLPTGTAGRTISAVFRYTASPVGFDASFFGYGDHGGIQRAYFLTHSATFNRLGVECNGGGSYITWTPDTVWHVMTAVSPSGGGNINQSDVWLDGGMPSTFRESFGVNTVATAINIGGADPNVLVAGAWIWNRALSYREIMQHQRDPFCMLEVTSLFRDVQSWVDLAPRFYPGYTLSLSYIHPEIIIPGSFSCGLSMGSAWGGFDVPRPATKMEWGGGMLWGDMPWGGFPKQPDTRMSMQMGFTGTASVGYQKASQCDFQFGAAFVGHHQANGVFESDSLLSSLFVPRGGFMTPFESDQLLSARFTGTGGWATPFSCGLQMSALFVGSASDAGIVSLEGDSTPPPPPTGESGSYAN